MSMRTTYQLIGINPQPWAIGPVNRSRGGAHVGPNLKLQNYQEEVRFELRQMAPIEEALYDGDVTLEFYFWRCLEKWETGTGRKSGDHKADATNLQKGLEDALQGVIFKNDNQVRLIMSEIVDQSPDTKPGILIVMKKFWMPTYMQMNGDVLAEFLKEKDSARAVPLDLGNEY